MGQAPRLMGGELVLAAAIGLVTSIGGYAFLYTKGCSFLTTDGWRAQRPTRRKGSCVNSANGL
jgi:hypothetical protein